MRRFQLSHNHSLDGVLDQLNSKNVTDAGPVQLVDDDDSADEAELLGPAGASAQAAESDEEFMLHHPLDEHGSAVTGWVPDA